MVEVEEEEAGALEEDEEEEAGALKPASFDLWQRDGEREGRSAGGMGRGVVVASEKIAT